MKPVDVAVFDLGIHVEFYDFHVVGGSGDFIQCAGQAGVAVPIADDETLLTHPMTPPYIRHMKGSNSQPACDVAWQDVRYTSRRLIDG